jgi:hypothetical protein
MSDFQAIADRVEIEALRGEFTDAVMMRDRARLASLFTPSACLASMRTSTPAGGTRPSGHASWPWTVSPAPTTSGG